MGRPAQDGGVRATHAIGYWYLKHKNKEWVEEQARKAGLSGSQWVDFHFQDLRVKAERKGKG